MTCPGMHHELRALDPGRDAMRRVVERRIELTDLNQRGHRHRGEFVEPVCDGGYLLQQRCVHGGRAPQHLALRPFAVAGTLGAGPLEGGVRQRVVAHLQDLLDHFQSLVTRQFDADLDEFRIQPVNDAVVCVHENQPEDPIRMTEHDELRHHSAHRVPEQVERRPAKRVGE